MFIEVNGRILEKREYEREILLLKRLVEIEFQEVINQYGFRKKGKYFLHKKTGLKISLLVEEPEQKPL